MLFVLQSEHGCRDTVSKQNVRTVLERVPATVETRRRAA